MKWSITSDTLSPTVFAGCFFFVGAALPGAVRPHHQAVFDFDERALLVSASVLVQIVRDELRNL